MNYSDYKIADWVNDDVFIAYVNGAKDETIDSLKNDPDHSENIKKAERLVKNLECTRPKVHPDKIDSIFESINLTIDYKETANDTTSARIISMKWVGIAAAAVAIFAIALPFFMASETNHITSIAEQQTFKLPDSSIVQLNSVSSVKYNTKSWKKHRYLVLQGEAFFDVESGSKFMVKSNQGIVTVLGTQFNIRDRLGVYEVECLEGKVEVTLQTGKTFTLDAGDMLSQIDGKKAILEQDVVQKIDWLEDYVNVENLKISKVLEEVARHFDVTFENADSINEKTYTGYFSTTSLDSAMQQIFWPMDVEYVIKNNKVILK